MSKLLAPTALMIIAAGLGACSINVDGVDDYAHHYGRSGRDALRGGERVVTIEQSAVDADEAQAITDEILADAQVRNCKILSVDGEHRLRGGDDDHWLRGVQVVLTCPLNRPAP